MLELTTSDLKRNQNLLLASFAYTTFHGALRKWVFIGSTGIDNVLLFIQLILPFLLIWQMKRKMSVFSYPLLIPYALVLVAMALNPLNQSLYHGVFGFILHFSLWLLLLAYLNERDSFPLENLVGAFVIIALIEIVLSFAQFSLPSTNFINRYVSSDNVDGFGEEQGVRIIGTFSYISGYAAYLLFGGLLAWALMLENKRSLLTIFGVAGLGLVTAFMNGSRSAVLPFVLVLVFGFLRDRKSVV